MTKVRCLKRNCKFNQAMVCGRTSVSILDSPLYPDLARCDNFKEKKAEP